MVTRLADLPATAEALGNVALHNLADLDLQVPFRSLQFEFERQQRRLTFK